MKAALLAALALALLAGCAEEPPEAPERWVVEELGTNAGFRDVFFLDRDRGWIVGGGYNIEGGILGRTSDGGASWTFRDRVVKPSGRVTSFHVNAVHFLDEERGFAVGDGYSVLRTVDGGEHWHRLSPRRGAWAHLSDLHFVGSRHGWAVGSGGLLRTEDGGETWEGVFQEDDDESTPRTPAGRALHFADEERGWIVGSHGAILASSDGGQTWTWIRKSRSGAPGLWGVDFVDVNRGWAVGEHGTILHTTDGGVSWQRQASGVEDTLMDVDFLDASEGWAVGFERAGGSSCVLWTVDGGATWTEQARVETEELRALFVLDDAHAWALGAQQRRTDHDGSQKILRYEVRGLTP